MSRSRQSITADHYDIMMQWMNKYITPTGQVVDKYTQDSVKIVYDVGQPNCFGCDLPVLESDEERDETDIKKIWNRKQVGHKLQRCHIVPDSLGGKPTPDNLFLLCPKCHEESPDTTNRNAFFRWVYNQRISHCSGLSSPVKIIQSIDKQLQARGLGGIKELLESIPYENMSLFNELISYQKRGEQYLLKNVTTHGFGRLNENSMVIAFTDMLLESYNTSILS